MNTLVTIAVTLLMLGILVIVHEGGHYLAARAFKVGIMEFSIGMGPVIFKKKGKYNDFSVRALPIGGFVSMIGEDDEADIPEEHLGKPSINDKKTWQKMIIVLAGPFMNILLSVLLMTGLVFSADVIGSTTVAYLVDEAKSEETGLPVNTSGEYGLQAGDTILEINGKKIRVYYDMAYYLTTMGNEPVDLVVERDGKEVELKGVCFPVDEMDGIKYGSMDFIVYRKDKTFANVCYEAFWQPVSTIRTTVQGIVDTVSGRYGISGVSGVVGMGDAMSEVISTGESIGIIITDLLNFMVLISVSLGIFNLIPLPALDGGRFVIYAIEGIIGRRLPQKAVTIAISVSMGLLLLLMVLITFKDIVKLF